MYKRLQKFIWAVCLAVFCALLTIACGEKPTVTISFAGTMTDTASISGERGQTVTLPKLTDPDDFYKFEGWFSDENLQGEPLVTVKLSVDIVLYAKWTPITFTVTYNPNGGTYSKESDTFTCLTPLFPGTPVRPGYAFDGWYTDSGLTQPFFSTVGLNRDVEVFAAWKADAPAPYLAFTRLDDGSWSVALDSRYAAPAHVVIPCEYDGAAVTEIAAGAFSDRRLTRVTLYDNIKRIGDNAFAGTGLASIDLSHVTQIGNRSFAGCALKDITLKSVVSVGDYAFSDCALQYVTFGEAIAEVSQSAFFACPLRAVTCLSETPPSLDAAAFGDADSFRIYVPGGSLAQYEGAAGWQKYYQLDRLHDIAVIDGDYAIATETVEGVTRCRLLQYFGGATAVVPDRVTEIESYAFNGVAVRDVTVGDVTRIGQYAFPDSLQALTINAKAPPALNSLALTCTPELTIKVPKTLEAAYRAAEDWQNFVACLEFFEAQEVEPPVVTK